MATQTDIYNLALYKIAQSISVASINDEAKSADVLNRLWDHARDLVLSDRTWPWAIRAAALAQSTEDAQPGWAYRYEYPNDCITAKAVTDLNGLRQVRTLSNYCDPDFIRGIWGSGAFDFETSYGEQATTINTDVKSAYLVYIVRVEDTGRYSAQFAEALACRLAVDAAPPLVGDIGLNSKTRLMQDYAYALTNAGAHSMNEGREDQEPVTPSMAARY